MRRVRGLQGPWIDVRKTRGAATVQYECRFSYTFPRITHKAHVFWGQNHENLVHHRKELRPLRKKATWCRELSVPIDGLARLLFGPIGEPALYWLSVYSILLVLTIHVVWFCFIISRVWKTIVEITNNELGRCDSFPIWQLISRTDCSESHWWIASWS